MARYIARVRTPMTVDEAFAYMADLTNFAEWDPGVKESVQVDGSGPGLDAAYDVTLDNAASMTLRYEVTEFTSPHRLKAVAKASWFTSIDVIEVRSEGDSTLVVYDATLQLPWYLRIADPLLAKKFNEIGDKAGAGMERALDGTLVS